jgi:MFS family permease
LSTSAEALVVSRFAMGTFAALIFPTTLSIISNTFRERKERAAALGVWGAVVGLGVAAGPVTGGLLLEHFSWNSVFWALVPLALVAALAAYLIVPESRDPHVPRLDFPGLGLSVAMWWLRAAAWLDGTTLRIRGAFRSRRIDLATADVTLGTVTHTSEGTGYQRVPVLVARDPASGRRVKLSLSGAGMDRLPPVELRALADAMIAGRPEESPADAWQVASHLRQMADNPLDLPAR